MNDVDDAWSDIPGLGVPAGPVVSEDGAQRGSCPDCGKLLTITASGNLRSHKCINDVQSTPTASGAKGSKRGKTPKQVRKLGVAGIASAVEWMTAETVARSIPCKPSEVTAADLGDSADIMIGPFLDLLWPRMPKGAQKAIASLADETDLLLAAFAWAEWGRNLKAWTEAARAEKERTHGPVPGQADQGGVPGVLGLVPFAPDTPGTAAL